MMISERIQWLIHKLEVGGGSRIVWMALGLAAVVGLTVLYDTRAYHSFNSSEAMDAAQVARNVSEGRGFVTDFIRPFSIYLVQKHNRAAHPEKALATNFMDFAQVNTPHPDLANAPVYPTVLAGLIKFWTPQWTINLRKPFWSEGGRFLRYQPEFRIAILNQVLLLVVALLTFLLARKLFDAKAAWLAAALTLGSDLLWKFSVSGLSTMLLLVIFLGLIWSLVKTDELGRTEQPDPHRLFLLAITAGLLAGLGMLTRYSFGWLIVPAAVFLAGCGGNRRTGLIVAALLAFAFVVSPWIVRNLSVSGTFFGTAGYAVAEGVGGFAGSELIQSLTPDFSGAHRLTPYAMKFFKNFGDIVQSDLLLIGGWAGILFFAGLLLGLRHVPARRLRYFTVASLGVLVIVEALGRTHLSTSSPGINSENLLVLLIPLVNIFGAVFFLTLLDQMKTPARMARSLAMSLVVGLAVLPLIWTVVMKASPVAYPPYYPPEIQKIGGWMRQDELTMSDVPWAVAWYGDRQCVWTTLNPNNEFFSLNDYIKPVNALYLTSFTLDAKFLNECLRGSENSWPNFGFKKAANNESPPQFPLRYQPANELYGAGLFLTDRRRWPIK